MDHLLSEVMESLVEKDSQMKEAVESLRISGNESYDLVAGTEDLGAVIAIGAVKLGEGASFLTGKLFDGATYVGNKALENIKNGFNNANRAVQVSFGTNQMAINKVISDLGKGHFSGSNEISSSTVASLTSTGVLTDIGDDIKDLTSTLGLVRSHAVDVEGYLQKRLSIMKELIGVKTNEKAAPILTKLDTLTKPILKFPHKPTENTYVSEVLPGGKVLKFTVGEHENHYSMSGERPAGHGTGNGYTSDQWKDIVKQLNGVNEHHKAVSKSMESYVKFVSNWTNVVKSLSETIDKDNELSATFKRDIEKLMCGDKEYLLFYSVFLPRIVSFNNSFINTLLKLISKSI